MVYFLQMGIDGPIKIGFSRDEQSLKKRIAALGGVLPYPSSVRGVIRGVGREEEAAIHHRFLADHLRGEWFSPSAALVSFIASLEDVDFVAPLYRDAPYSRAALEAADERWRALTGTLV
jgi:hypothetical protein